MPVIAIKSDALAKVSCWSIKQAGSAKLKNNVPEFAFQRIRRMN